MHNNNTAYGASVQAQFDHLIASFPADKIKMTGNGALLPCPLHDDEHPSLDAAIKNDRLLVICRAGCDKDRLWDEVRRRIPKSEATISEVVYDYRDENNQLLSQSVRRVARDGSKKFVQRKPDGCGGWHYKMDGARRVPYRLPELLSKEPGSVVYIVEGEKDADNLVRLGLTATTNIGGAGKWRAEYNEYFRNLEVVIFPDNDEPGRKHAKQVAHQLTPIAKSVKIVELPGLPVKGDVSDWLQHGGTLEQLQSIVDNAGFLADIEAQAQTSEPVNKSRTEKEGRFFIGTERNEPTPLLRQEDVVETFPIDSLGPLKDVVVCCQAIDQAPMSVTAFSYLAAANLAVQAHADLEIDGRVSPVSSFFVSIAETGERKSAVDRAATVPIRMQEALLQGAYDADLAKYNIALEAYNAERKNIVTGKNKSKAEIEAALEALGEPPLPPIQPDILVSDPTFEGLCKQLYFGRPSLGIFADEGGIFLGGYSMKEDEAVRTGAGLSNFWDGKTLSRVRASAETFKLPGRRLSMHLLIQPAIAPMLLGNALLKGQGFLSRCLVASASNVENRTYVERDLTQEPAYEAYLDQMLKVLVHDLPIADKKKNALKPRRILLTPEAKAEYIQYHDAIQKQMGKGQLLNSVKGLAAKAHDLAARIAATLALFENIDCTLVHVDHMRSGIDLVTFCLTEALRLFEAAPADESLCQADLLLQWLKDKERGDRAISLVEIYQTGPAFVRSATKARQLLSLLWRHGQLVRVEEFVDYAGMIRREVFRVCH